ncbi:MAG TPA: transketolase [bacterium]
MNVQTTILPVHALAVNTIRMLAVDGTNKANSGHPGMPMGMADCAFILWNRFLRFNPQDPEWPNRDRFVLSAGHGSMLLYAMLYLSGYEVTLEDLKEFRQWESRTPGHPEYGCLPGVETTTGPLGQGFANGVGMALASKISAARFNRDGHAIIDHRVFAVVSDGDLMEGVSSEAASLAGHLKLGNLVYLYDDNHITIEGNTSLAFSEDVEKRFQAYGWHTIRIDGHDHNQISEALRASLSETSRPSLILARTHIGYGSPNKQDHESVHGAPLGKDETVKTKEHLNWPLSPEFFVPEEVKKIFKDRTDQLRPEYDAWQKRFAEWQKACPDLAELWKRMRSKELPHDLEEQMLSTVTDKPTATRLAGNKVLQKAAEIVPGLIGGSADLHPSTKTLIEKQESIAPGAFSGRNLHFGVREHAMGGILNGLALYGGWIPYGSTFLVFSDYMRPSIRLSALIGTQVIYVFTHDSIFVGEDGPTHQPIEHVAALRIIPNLIVLRPADSLETALSWSYALRHQDGPTVICLTRQNVPNLTRPVDFAPRNVYKGGYILSKEKGSKPDVVLVATGSEVNVAVGAKEILTQGGKDVRVISMPSVDLFGRQPKEVQDAIVPRKGVPIVVIEAGVPQGWRDITDGPFLFIGMHRFGASAPQEILAEKFGFTAKSVAEKTLGWLGKKS